MRFIISLSAAIALIIVALLLASIYGDVGHTANATAHPSSSLLAQGEPSDGVRRITPVEARNALGKGAAVVIDVRSEEAYKAGHIKGARWISVDEIATRIKELPRDKMIITYCS